MAVSVRVAVASAVGSPAPGALASSPATNEPPGFLPIACGVFAGRVTGRVHLFRTRPRAPSPGRPPGASLPLEPPPFQLPVTDTLCALAVPGTVSVADLLTFAGALAGRIRELRLVLQDDPPADSGAATPPSPLSSYCVLLRFDGCGSAEEFYRFHHGRPFTSLEPHGLCHLLFVRDVELVTAQQLQMGGGGVDPATGGDAVGLPCDPPGQAELPSCPVCLERLDAHISGVITTVCNHTFHAQCAERL